MAAKGDTKKSPDQKKNAHNQKTIRLFKLDCLSNHVSRMTNHESRITNQDFQWKAVFHCPVKTLKNPKAPEGKHSSKNTSPPFFLPNKPAHILSKYNARAIALGVGWGVVRMNFAHCRTQILCLLP